MGVGVDILATQFHAELTPALISRWAHISQYLAWLDRAMGPNAYKRVKARSRLVMPKAERLSRTLFENLPAHHNGLRVAA